LPLDKASCINSIVSTTKGLIFSASNLYRATCIQRWSCMHELESSTFSKIPKKIQAFQYLGISRYCASWRAAVGGILKLLPERQFSGIQLRTVVKIVQIHPDILRVIIFRIKKQVATQIKKGELLNSCRSHFSSHKSSTPSTNTYPTTVYRNFASKLGKSSKSPTRIPVRLAFAEIAGPIPRLVVPTFEQASLRCCDVIFD